MLVKKTLIEKLGEEYAPMINKISIPDFTKCIAQYSGIRIQDLKDDVIEGYLTLWARNKKYLFDFFGDTRVDFPIEYIDEDRDYGNKIVALAKDYPVYYPWLSIFSSQVSNKIDTDAISYSDTRILSEAFPSYRLAGVSLTHFFKGKLNAPDELVTELGRVFENAKVQATYTLSIDPVDIMLSSENPYNWTSCYRLERPFCESHADGCLAGVIDGSTVISYLWNREGKFSLYDNYEFKNIRYKKVRITLAFNETFNAIHFNDVYPWKGDTTEGFRKMIRDKVETYVAEKQGKRNLWTQYNWKGDFDLQADRQYDQYGYGEYSSRYVWLLKDDEDYAPFKIYSEEILCPCGCGDVYMGSDSENDDYYEYNGDGHVNDNWYESEQDPYCDEIGDYVDYCDGDCENCEYYRRNHPVCDIDGESYCHERNGSDAEWEGDADFSESNIINCNPEYCNECPFYRQHRPKMFEDMIIKYEGNIYGRKDEHWYMFDESDNTMYWLAFTNAVCDDNDLDKAIYAQVYEADDEGIEFLDYETYADCRWTKENRPAEDSPIKWEHVEIAAASDENTEMRHS